MSNEMTKVKGVAFWASLDKVNSMSGKYQIDIGQLSDNAVKALESEGIPVHNKGDDRGNFMTCKSNYTIFALDPNGDRVTTGVGNGSEVSAVIGTYSWTFKNKKGVSPSIKKLVVTKLVEYVPENNIEIDDSDVL